MARAFASGAQILGASNSGNAISLAFVSAQAAECALKAYLSRSGDDTRLKDRRLRHDLVALWALSIAEGLAVNAAPPNWLLQLGHLHAYPYHLRYSTGVNGLVTPATQPMVGELVALVEQVASQI
jgi:HEPN domain-containing protein